jgi:laminin alpha 3/5
MVLANGICRICECDLTGTTDEICDKNNGVCLCNPNFTGAKCDQCAPGFYNYPNWYVFKKKN